MYYIKFGIGETSNSIENKIYLSGTNSKRIDFLVFVDSRGLVSDKTNNKSYIELLKLFFETKNLTTFATLFNFLKLNNDLKIEKLITNLGFVDYTQKKENNIKDIQQQISQFVKEDTTIINHENYKLNNGQIELLKNLEYSVNYIKELGKYFNNRFKKVYFINTPLVSKNIAINRTRPDSFFTQLIKTNQLIEKLLNETKEKSTLIDIKTIICTYDGVHHTNDAHQKIFRKLIERIKV